MLISGLTITFLREFGLGLWVPPPLLLTLGALIVVLGLIVGKNESWARFDNFYWSFVTATAVGYGDIRPTTRVSRLIAIIIALLGLSLTGMLIAIALHAATVAFAAHDATSVVK